MEVSKDNAIATWATEIIVWIGSRNDIVSNR
jgi:hypothetical protein